MTFLVDIMSGLTALVCKANKHQHVKRHRQEQHLGSNSPEPLKAMSGSRRHAEKEAAAG